MYLVDTNVISQAAPTHKLDAAALVDWMDAHSNDLFVSAITIAEIEAGIAKLRREGSRRKAASLGEWLEVVLHLYSERVLGVGVSVARVLGPLSDRARAIGKPPGLADLIIAATAIEHGLTILTRNVKHFTPLGVKVHDPFSSLPKR